jgi:hypothetical protein
MDQRMLGRTRVPVSKLYLGATTFGASGEPDQNESIQIIHTAHDAGISRPTTPSSPISPGPTARLPPKRCCAGECSTAARSCRSP